MIDGDFFEIGSSKADPARISIDGKMVSVFKENQCLYKHLAIDSVQDNKNIFLDNGCLFVARKNLSNNQIKSLIPRSESWLKSLDQFRFKTIAIFLLILILLVTGYRFALVSLSSEIVNSFPHSWERKIGEATFDTLDRMLLQDSDLTGQRIKEITRRAEAILEEGNLPVKPKIIFKKSEIIGPNALALPGGPIIVTDDLVELLKDDSLILSIIAHEIAHVQERHSLQQIVEIVGLSSLAWLVFGLDEGVLEEIALVGVNLWGLKKSRDFEKESDLIALELLENAGLPKDSFILAIEKLNNHFCQKADAEPYACIENARSGWLSTHPSTDERLKYLRASIK